LYKQVMTKKKTSQVFLIARHHVFCDTT